MTQTHGINYKGFLAPYLINRIFGYNRMLCTKTKQKKHFDLHMTQSHSINYKGFLAPI